MDSAYISKDTLTRLKNHASESFPNECIGFFECHEDNGDFYITEVFERKNIAKKKRESGLLAKRDFRKFNKLAKTGKRKGIFYGVYHSHPISGSINLGEQDMYSGSIFKLFRLQMIIGIKRNGKIRIAFWKTSDGNWFKRRIRTRRF